jgi:LmbE family N-acetylglucosaminyl deacetylase
MRWIYISPHLDDVVLSAGGFISDQTRGGASVEIWTICCGFPPITEPSPFAQALHFQWGFSSAEETVRSRRAEDERAAAAVGAKAVHFDFLDCIYRRDPAGEWIYPIEVFVPPQAADGDLVERMTAAIAARLRPDDVLAGPLAIGHHVDHVTVRKAVEGLGRPISFFADIPYLLNHPEHLEPATIGMDFKKMTVSAAGIAAWQDGIDAYASQISMLFETSVQMRAAIDSYARSGFRFWKSV